MKYVIAQSAEEALKALKDAEGRGTIIAGGTDVMVELHEGERTAEVLVDITKAADLRGIRIDGKEIVIGSAATLSEIASDPIVRQYYPSLCKGTGSVGSLQIRNTGTLVGNIVTAQPAADGAMSVAPLNPVIVVRTFDGEKRLKISDMYVGFGKTALDTSKELVTEIRIPVPEKDEKASFVRLELRKSLSLPMLNAAAMVKYSENKVVWARITMGPVGVGPTRAAAAEEWLKGKELTEENMAEAGRLALKDANPRSNPLRGSREYREHSLPIIIRRVLEDIKAQF